MRVADQPPPDYPTKPDFFNRRDVLGLEMQYNFYERAYGHLDQLNLAKRTRIRVEYLLNAIQDAYANGEEADHTISF